MKRPTTGWRVTLLIEKLANNIGFRIQENYCEKIKPMKIEDWESASSMPMLYRELQGLGLESNIAELEAFGFTVVPPEKVAPPAFHEAVQKALRDCPVRHSRSDHDPANW